MSERKKKMKNGVGKLKAPSMMHLISKNRLFTVEKILVKRIDGKQDYLA
jgi:hypothetical protein